MDYYRAETRKRDQVRRDGVAYLRAKAFIKLVGAIEDTGIQNTSIRFLAWGDYF